MVQREFRNPATGVERVSLGEILTGTLSFAMLQNWCRARSEAQSKELGVIEPVWDLVVVDTEDLTNESDKQTPEFSSSFGEVKDEHDSMTVQENPDRLVRNSSNKFVRKPKDGLRQHLSQQLRPGTAVSITAQSTTHNLVKVLVAGTDGHVDRPPGYALVSVRQEEAISGPLRQFVFQSTDKRTRTGSFKVEDRNRTLPSGLGISDRLQDVGPRLERHMGPFYTEKFDASTSQPAEQADLALITSEVQERTKANMRRPRPCTDDATVHDIGLMESDASGYARSYTKEDESPGKSSKRAVWRKTFLQRGTSYKNLVDFWSHAPSQRKFVNPEQHLTHQRRQEHDIGPSSEAAVPSVDTSRPSSTAQQSFVQDTPFLRPSLDVERRPGSRESFHTRSIHRRGGSSIYNLHTNGSESSLVLHAKSAKPTRECLAQSLTTTGRLAGQFPEAPFAKNVARFVRFASASYGSNFLRLTGASTETDTRVGERYDEHPEHRSFSTYARLPSSTILLSSFVDPEGGTDMHGETHSGLLLTHYICLDHESKAVVVTCRGTLGFEDVLTDLTCDYEHLYWQGRFYEVHKGMLASARRLLYMHDSRLIATIRAALEEFQDYGLILCGHSLGGGVAAILGLLMAQPCEPSSMPGYSAAYVTASTSPYVSAPGESPRQHSSDAIALTLPPNRPIHVYAFGPAATMCPALAGASRGLITTIVNNADIVPGLSLGNLRDIQSVSLALKTDESNATGELRRRVWQSVRKAFTETSGLGPTQAVFSKEWLQGQAHMEEDVWPWATLKSLRAGMLADKLVPPGECFVVESRIVLQRLAFVDASGVGSNGQTFKPASQLKVTHVKDVAKRFAEIRFEGSMLLDHLPARYEKILEALWLGVA